LLAIDSRGRRWPRRPPRRAQMSSVCTMLNDGSYRQIIDRLVESCLRGQGQMGARRARAGLWNRNADSADGSLADQWRMNQLLLSLSSEQRDVLGEMLTQQFVGGVHETLVVLHETGIPPLDEGYEGDPFHDFVGRLGGWEWPSEGQGAGRSS